jgi:hypothetical protein
MQTQSKKRMHAITIISAALFIAPMAFFEYLSLVSKAIPDTLACL